MCNLLNKARVAIFFALFGFTFVDASVTFYIEDQLVDESAIQVVVPVKVSGYESVGAFQFSLRWDPDVLSFSSVQTYLFNNGEPLSGFYELGSMNTTTYVDDGAIIVDVA